METLIQDVNLNAFTRDEFEINHGGCGIYALAVARYLMNRGIDKLELVVCCRNYEPELKEKIYNNNHIIGNVPSHIVVKAGEHCFDAEGVFEHDRFINEMKNDGKECITIDFIERDLVEAINNRYDWNPYFERIAWIPKFEQSFNISLEDIIT